MEANNLPAEVRNASPEELQEYLQVYNEKLTQTTIYIFTSNHVYLFLFYYAFAKLIEFMLKRRYPNLTTVHLKNCTTYVLEIVITTIALVLNLVIWKTYENVFVYRDYKIGQFAMLTIVDLYIFELIYRPTMRIPLIIHHVSTITMITFSSYLKTNTDSLKFWPIAVTLLFQAITEQTTFVGLLFYRVKREWAAPVLLFASAQVFCTKTGALIWSFILWGQNSLPNIGHYELVTVWNAIFPIFGTVLFATQIWSTYVVVTVGLRARREANAKLKEKDTEMNSSSSSTTSDDDTETATEVEIESPDAIYKPKKGGDGS